MKNIFSKEHPVHTVKAVYSVKIDLGHNYNNSAKHYSEGLHPGGRYYFGKNEQSVTYEAIRDFVTGVIESELSDICKMYIDMPVAIKVSGKYDGSLIIVFSAVFSAIQLISGLKDVYDIAKLIRDLADERIKNRLAKEYGNYFDVWVERRIPKDWDGDYERYMLKNGRLPINIIEQQPKKQRDAFFWYLLILNIVLFGVILLLVLNAVLQVYW